MNTELTKQTNEGQTNEGIKNKNQERVLKCRELSNELRRLSFEVSHDNPLRYFYEELGSILTYLNHLENYGKTRQITLALSHHAKSLHEIAKELRGLSND